MLIILMIHDLYTVYTNYFGNEAYRQIPFPSIYTDSLHNRILRLRDGNYRMRSHLNFVIVRLAIYW